jgi:hypothetical protein
MNAMSDRLGDRFMSRWPFAVFSILASFTAAAGQTPPMPLPPTVLAKREVGVNLPRSENLRAIDPKTLSVKRLGGQWQLWADDAAFKTFGDNADDANDVARTLRELYPQRWGAIGTGRAVVEYGLTTDNDQKLVAPRVAGFARSLAVIDPKTLRVERIRGMWCLRDDANLHLNFGPHRDDAEQALAVAQKYGFNRIGTVGRKGPAMTYFTGAPDGLAPASAKLPAGVSFRMQVDAMTRTGIPLPTFGVLGERKRFDPATVEYVGEMTPIDPRKAELRTESGGITLVCGGETLARFATNDDFAAREALRALRDARLTEHCRIGTAGCEFFLSNGQAPRNMPLHALGPRFDPAGLRTVDIRGAWHVADALGRPLAPAGTRDDAEAIRQLMRAFGFDQIATFGGGKPAMTVFIKSR